VEDVAVVVDAARVEALAVRDITGTLEQAMPVGRELIGPGERPATRDGAEPIEVAGLEQDAQPSLARAI
jgi:hypothetical protein